MTKLSDLKEFKLPKYVVGISYNDWSNSYLSASASRSRAKECLDGTIKTLFDSETDAAVKDQLQMENERAFHDLVSCMPYGRLLHCVASSKTEQFPKGCAATAWAALKSKIIEVAEQDS